MQTNNEQLQIIQDTNCLCKSPHVSVIIVTYNHEKFIIDCIEHVVSQRTPFQVEILVGEDCSTDQTRKLCLDAQAKYPGQIRLFLQCRNVGIKENTTTLLEHVRGNYISFCDGDDYFCDEHKLARQAEVLDKNPCIGLIHGRALLQHGDYKFTRRVTPLTSHCKILNEMCDWPTEKRVNQLLLRNYCCTSTVMIRTSIFRKMYPMYCQTLRTYSIAPSTDFVMWVLMASQSKIKFQNEVVAVRRLHSRSVTSLLSRPFQYNRLRGDALLRYYLAWNLDGVTDQSKERVHQQITLMTALCRSYGVPIPDQRLYWPNPVAFLKNFRSRFDCY